MSARPAGYLGSLALPTGASQNFRQRLALSLLHSVPAVESSRHVARRAICLPRSSHGFRHFEGFRPVFSLRKNALCATFSIGFESGPSTFTLASAEGTKNSPERQEFVSTTPLYYVNAPPHMGSAYPTMAVDALCRYYRLKGKNTVMVTGTDEHGEKIATTAESRGKEPKAHCDEISEEFQKLWSKLSIRYDSFIRTTDPRHEEIVRQVLERVWKNGDIYKKDYEGLYCVGCEEFKDTKELLEGNVCPLHQKPVVERKEENYFFALSKYQDRLEKLLSENPEFVQPEFRLNEVLGWVKEGLRDFSISRAKVEWGIPIPRDPSQTVYVWFDALLGYVSALLKDDDPADLEKALSRGWPADVHVIGKDILRFHAVYWPAMLMSAGMPLPKKVFGHGFLTKDGLKMGKSLGNTIDPDEMADKYGADALRYYFLKIIEFGADGDFAMERFVNLLNAELANDLGNLVNRTLKLGIKNCDGKVPNAIVPFDDPLRLLATEQLNVAAAAYERLDFTAACNASLAISGECNRYLNEAAPWSLYKKGLKDDADKVLYTVMESFRICAIILSPVTPTLSHAIYTQLGYSQDDWDRLNWSDAAFGGLPMGQQLGNPAPVFQRLEMPEEVEAPAPAPAVAGGKKK